MPHAGWLVSKPYSGINVLDIAPRRGKEKFHPTRIGHTCINATLSYGWFHKMIVIFYNISETTYVKAQSVLPTT